MRSLLFGKKKRKPVKKEICCKSCFQPQLLEYFKQGEAEVKEATELPGTRILPTQYYKDIIMKLNIKQTAYLQTACSIDLIALDSITILSY
jgi:hypothetical protein